MPAPPASNITPEAQDTQWITNLQLQFALADSDLKFQNLLSVYLNPLLKKLGSTINDQIMALLGHINTLLKNSATIIIPVNSLLQEFHTASALVKNFMLIYIEMGIGRIPDEESFGLISLLMKDIHIKTPSQQEILFSIILSTLLKHTSHHQNEFNTTTRYMNLNLELKFLMDGFLQVIMYSVPFTKSKDNEQTQIMYGLGPSSLKFITHSGKAIFTSNATELSKVKLGILTFISKSEFVADNEFLLEKFMIFLWASCDSYYEVSTISETGLKRFTKPDFESEYTIKTICQMYLGTSHLKKENTLYKAPASPAVKCKIIHLVLCKSITAANIYPQFLQISFDAIFGDGTSKLAFNGMSFLIWILKMAETEKLNSVSKIFFNGLIRIISQDPTLENMAIRASAYESLGLLSKKSPKLLEGDISTLSKVFDAIETEPESVRFSIQGALTSMTDSFAACSLSPENSTNLEELLLRNIKKDNHHCRYSAIKFSNSVLSFNNINARYICLLASGDSKLEVKEEAKLGLKFPELKIGSTESETVQIEVKNWKEKIPDFQSTAVFIIQKAQEGAFSQKVLVNTLMFIRQLLIRNVNPEADPSFFDIVLEDEDMTITDIDTISQLKNWLKSNSAKLLQYIELLNFGLDSHFEDPSLRSTCSQFLLELISWGPSALCEIYKSKISQIKIYLNVSQASIRKAVAHIIGIISTFGLESVTGKEELISLIYELQSTIKSEEKSVHVDSKDGAYLALGYVIGRLIYRHGLDQDIVFSKIICESLYLLQDGLSSSSGLIIKSCCLGLAEACRYSLNTMDYKCEETNNGMISEKSWDIFAVVDKLILISKSSTDHKIQEAAMYSLGQIAVKKDSVSKKVCEFFYTLSPITSKNIEMCFTVGEALCACVFGFVSQNMKIYLDISDSDEQYGHSEYNAENASEMLKTTLDLAAPDKSVASRKMACVWLLCIVKYCGNTMLIKDQLPKLHTSFSLLLSDRDEFIQEAASKGIGLLFDLGDSKMKDALIKSLVADLSEGRKIAPQSVQSDTLLFDNNSLGNTPDGAAISTYQSVLSLAADLNQPDLVYRFMSLASHNAIWNSKKGASLGFSTIAVQAKHQLSAHLPKIIPKLYRYQFDPSPQVAESMKGIWSTLITEPIKSLNEYFEIIIKDLLICIVDSQWRTREASCNALSDLIHGRQISEIEPYLQELWNLCFRALDDIKESVRIAAFKTCKTLTNFTLKYCDVEYSSHSDGKKVLDIVIPFFLTKGISSMSDDVRAFSIKTLLKICEKGQTLLKSHITEIIGTLLEGLSAFEPQTMNYLSFHADKYNITQEQLESSRLQATKMSPMMGAIERCIDQVDETVLSELIPRLCNIIRKGVGLPTRAGSARIVCSLSLRLPNDMALHSSAILKALSGVIQDRSLVLRKAVASAIGHICRLASQETLIQFIHHNRKFYLDAEDDDLRQITGLTFKELARYAPDQIKSIMGEVLPIAFIGIHDSSEELKTVWVSVWDELAAGSSSAGRLWASEIMSLCEKLMKDSQSWKIKRQVSKSISDLAKSSGKTFDNFRSTSLSILLDALGGRTWDGKEDVIESLATFCLESKEWLLLPESHQLLSAVKDTIIREAKKNNKPYKRVAIASLGNIVQELQLDVFSEVEAYLVSNASDELGPDDMDVDDVRDKPLTLGIRANSYKALGKCFSARTRNQDDWKRTLYFLSNNLDKNIWNIRLAILEALEIIFKNCEFPNGILSKELEKILLDGIFISLQDGKYSSIREIALLVFKLFIEKTIHSQDEQDKAIILSLIESYEKRDSNSNILHGLSGIKKIIIESKTKN